MFTMIFSTFPAPETSPLRRRTVVVSPMGRRRSPQRPERRASTGSVRSAVRSAVRSVAAVFDPGDAEEDATWRRGDLLGWEILEKMEVL